MCVVVVWNCFFFSLLAVLLTKTTLSTLSFFLCVTYCFHPFCFWYFAHIHQKKKTKNDGSDPTDKIETEIQDDSDCGIWDLTMVRIFSNSQFDVDAVAELVFELDWEESYVDATVAVEKWQLEPYDWVIGRERNMEQMFEPLNALLVYGVQVDLAPHC